MNKQAIAIFTTCLCLASTTFAVSDYRVVELPTLGGSSSLAFGLNNNGQVVGLAKDTSGNSRAALWHYGNVTDLGCLPGGTTAVARAINDEGVIVGRSYVGEIFYHAFKYQDSTMYDLGTAGGAISRAYAITPNEDIAGWVTTPEEDPGVYTRKACVFDSEGIITNVGVYGGTRWYTREAWGINSHTQVVGTTFLYNPYNAWWGFIWRDDNDNHEHDDGETQVIGSFGGSASFLHDINDIGTAVGWAKDGSGMTWACKIIPTTNGIYKKPETELVTTNGLLENLGALGGTGSVARAINQNGIIVGSATNKSGTPRAFLWRNGSMTDLNTLIPSNSGWELTHAWDINEANEICGYGTYEGQTRGFLLTFPRAILTMHPHQIKTGERIWTNEFDQILTQDVYRTEGFEVRWSSSWISGRTNYRYTLEAFTPGSTSGWHTVEPTNLWPVEITRWTNFFVPAITHRWYRVRAETYE